MEQANTALLAEEEEEFEEGHFAGEAAAEQVTQVLTQD